MADTHINAYVQDVQDAAVAVAQAVGAYEAAVAVLKAQEGYVPAMVVQLPYDLVSKSAPQEKVAPKVEAKV